MKSIFTTCLSLYICLFTSNSYSQITFADSLYSELNTHPREKVYIHTDRDKYATDETIWMKIFVVQAGNNKPIYDNNTVYVGLIDPNGNKVAEKRVFCADGSGYNHIHLADSLPSGTYLLIGHTNYQKNFGYESFFQKKIEVNWVSKGSEERNPNKNLSIELSDTSIDFRFLPEGGYLSQNLVNKLAFKAIGSDGLGIDIKGRILNSAGNMIDTFSTKHRGMGYKLFLPRQDENYVAVLDGYLYDTIPLPKAVARIMMRKIRQDSSQITLLLLDAPNNFQPRVYTISVIAEQHPINSFTFTMDSPYKEFMIPMHYLAPGVNRITLFDNNNQPISNRLVFKPQYPQIDMQLAIAKDTYSRREEVNLELSIGEQDDTNFWANCLVSVINGNQLSDNFKRPINILSSLLLCSDLKGHVEEPAYYFQHLYADIANDLDLVLLTHGWRHWHCRTNSDGKPVYAKEQGITISGDVYNLMGKRKITTGQVTVMIPELNILQLSDIDEGGTFTFANMVFYDSSSMAIQATNKHENPYTVLKNVQSSLDGTIQSDTNIFPSLNFLKSDNDFSRNAYYRLKSMEILNPDKNMNYIDEVVITKTRSTIAQDVHTDNRRYTMADNTVEVGEDAASYYSVFSYLAGRVPGVSVSGTDVSIRGMGEPLFLVDGMSRDAESIANMSMSEIDLIEVLKSPSNLAVFGVRGGNGVIAIYTRRGENFAYIEPEYGTKSFQLKGYSKSSDFYAPKYNVKNENDDVPDHRATIYWNPAVIFTKSKAQTIRFYNADDAGKIEIIVEGICSDGRIVHKTCTYHVE